MVERCRFIKQIFSFWVVEMTEFEDEVIRLLKEILKKLNENKSI